MSEAATLARSHLIALDLQPTCEIDTEVRS
jgi:hypothetical protein